MPTLRLAGKAPAPKRKPAASTRTSTPKRKPAAKSKPAAAAAPAQASENGRSVRLPEGWSRADLNKVMKDMRKAREAKDKAAAVLAEAQEVVNSMALELIADGLQMSVVVDPEDGLAISRQWLYKIMEDNGVKTARQEEASKPARKRAASKPKPAAKKRPAAKATAKTAPARKRPAASAKAPARKRPAGRGVVRLAA